MKIKPRYHLDNAFTSPVPYGDISLIQLGRRFCAPGEVVAAHTHLGWYELTVVIGGSGEVFSNGEGAEVKKGDIYLSFPCDIHEIRADAHTGLEYDFFSFVCDGSPLADKMKEIVAGTHDVQSRIFSDEKIEFLIGCAICEMSEEGFDKKELLTSIFRQTVVYIARDACRNHAHRLSLSKSEVLCYRLMSYIDTHIYSIKSLSELSASFSYNYSYLSALFKQTTGKTLSEYYSDRRLTLARALVLEGKLKVWEIAEMLNYSSSFAFSKAFRARWGVPPLKMRSSEKEQ